MCCINVQAASQWLEAAVRDKQNGTGTRALSSYEAKVQCELRIVESMQAAKESSVEIFAKSTDASHMAVRM